MPGWWIRTLIALCAVALALGCTADSGTDTQAPSGRAGQPEEERSARSGLWVNPESDAARQVEEWQRQGRTEDAETLRLISERAVAEWPRADDPGPQIREAVTSAAEADSAAVLVVYNIPHRDCGQHSAGGAGSAGAYLDYIDVFAENIGDHPAIVILEPDAVPHMVDGCTPRMYHDERYGLLDEAVDRLTARPGTAVYLDAGNPSWIKDSQKLVEPLWRSGLAEADGFALNVSHFQTDDKVIAYGRKLSKKLGGEHFVVDTGRNGNGPLASGRAYVWCNPPGRALGTPPTTDTGDPLVDAFLWIKRPGESDGECRGGPRAGQWWPEYALGLARNAR
jgi:endoglucanase